MDSVMASGKSATCNSGLTSQESERKAQPSRVQCTRRGSLGVVSLHRPSALNALDHDMIQDIASALLSWRTIQDITCVVFDFAGDTGQMFSGSDLVMLSKRSSWDIRGSRQFFADQYRLIDLVRRYPKPVICLMRGTFIGFAASLASAAHARFATDDTVVRFPETAVGLVPDGASTWFLPRLKHEIGFWLALTGADIKGPDLEVSGLVTRVVRKHDIGLLGKAIAKTGPQAIESFIDGLPPVKGSHLPIDEISSAFSADSMEEILKRLSEGSVWARAQASRILERAPLSTRIVLRQMSTGLILSSPREALRLEYRILSRLVCTPNFREGVRASLSEKDRKPRWQPTRLSRVTANGIAPYFAAPREGELEFC